MGTVEVGDTIEFLEDSHFGELRFATVLVVYQNAITVEFSNYHREVYDLKKLQISKDEFGRHWIVDWIDETH